MFISKKLSGIKIFLSGITFFLLFVLFIHKITAANLTNGSVTLSDSRPSTTSSYTFSFSGATNTTIKCAKISLSTSASADTVPTGLGSSAAGVTVNASSSFVTGISGWTLDKATNGILKISNVTGGIAVGTTGTIIIDGVTNGSTADTGYFARFNTYSDQACTSVVDSNTVSFIYTNGQVLTVTVDPSLTFTVNNVAVGQTVNGVPTTVATTTNSIPLGSVTVGANVIAAQDLTVETNSGNGYTIYTRYTGALTNGSHSLTDFTGTNATPAVFSVGGTEAFGYTTDSTSLLTGTADRFATNKWAKFTTSNLEVGATNAPTTSAQTTRIGYQVGVNGSTPAGNYTTTIILTATPTY